MVGLFKVDVFVLGMFSVLCCSFDLIYVLCGGKWLSIVSILSEDLVIYEMISCVDIIGVF